MHLVILIKKKSSFNTLKFDHFCTVRKELISCFHWLLRLVAKVALAILKSLEKKEMLPNMHPMVPDIT